MPASSDHGITEGEGLWKPSSSTALFYIQEIQATEGKMACSSHIACWWQSQKT